MTYVTNPEAVVSLRDDGEYELSVVGDGSHVTDDPEILEVLVYAAEGRSAADVAAYARGQFGWGEDAADRLVEQLVALSLLIPVDEADEAAGSLGSTADVFHRRVAATEFADAEDPDEGRSELLDSYLERGSPPPVFPDLSGLERTPLPSPGALTGDGRVTERSLSALLHYAFDGVREVREFVAAQAADDPDAQFVSSQLPFDVHVVVRDCEGVAPGAYAYDMRSHALAAVDGDGALACGTGDGHADASVSVVFASTFDRYQWRYRYSRAIRNLLMEVSSHATRVAMVACSLGCGTVRSPPADGRAVESRLGLDGVEQGVTYVVSVRDADRSADR